MAGLHQTSNNYKMSCMQDMNDILGKPATADFTPSTTCLHLCVCVCACVCDFFRFHLLPEI